jgi:outer membrane protein assembly factor BamB
VSARPGERRAHGRAVAATTAGLLLALVLPSEGCSGLTARRPEAEVEHPGPAGVVHIAWRAEIHTHHLFEAAPAEAAAGAIAGQRLIIGSRAGTVSGVDIHDGHIDWVSKLSGGIDSKARLDVRRRQVYIGTDEGRFCAIDPDTGKTRWSYVSKGTIDQPAEIGPDALVYMATSADRVVALEADTGKWRWQYDRETPEGFTIHGYGAPRLVGKALLAGFADGYLVSLQPATGEVIWARSLASGSEQFVDVDSTPATDGAGVVFAASYSGGLYALDAKDGNTRWRMALEGAGPLSLIDGQLFVPTPHNGLHAIRADGQTLWRQGLANAGDVTAPQVLGHYLVFSGCRAGMFVVDRFEGRLLEVFNPGQGICAPPTLDPQQPGRLYVLSNGGTLYALDLD